ncbi:MAG: DegT/DnrJ/EryC1/StrS family aminotransferase [Magnetococcales bacterium]|nr:DegT/DnrJ/EryC1/StrS family aminotransferase [Magnetococcales bacterium]
MILCSNPKAQYLARQQQIDAAIHRVLESGHYILGPEVEQFESEFAAYTGADYAVGVGSGTDALHIALMALDLGPGSEVITVSHTAVATVAAIEMAGATPVFVDIDPKSYTIDPQAIEKAITPRTKVIIPVHIYGQAADMDGVLDIARRFGLKVVEDCAQAAGTNYKNRSVGSIGDLGCFSFFPTKNLGGLGDGGMITTSDKALAERVVGLRQYGWSGSRLSREPGVNSRLDELQAAILAVKLKSLDADNQHRRNVAANYDKALAQFPINTPYRSEDSDHIFHLYVVRSDKRDALLRHLHDNGVGAAVHYAVPVHMQPAYKSLARIHSLVVTEKAAGEILSLPIYPELAKDDLQAVIGAISSFKF